MQIRKKLKNRERHSIDALVLVELQALEVDPRIVLVRGIVLDQDLARRQEAMAVIKKKSLLNLP